MYQGELPLTVDMSRNFVGGRRFFARFERDGYVTQEFQLNREFNELYCSHVIRWFEAHGASPSPINGSDIR